MLLHERRRNFITEAYDQHNKKVDMKIYDPLVGLKYP